MNPDATRRGGHRARRRGLPAALHGATTVAAYVLCGVVIITGSTVIIILLVY